MEARRKDIDALAPPTGPHSKAFIPESKAGEILRATMDQLQSIVKTAAGSATSASTGRFVQQALQKAFLSMRELAEVAYKSQTDAFAVVSQRAAGEHPGSEGPSATEKMSETRSTWSP